MSAFVFAVIVICFKTGWDKRKEQKMPVGFVFAFAGIKTGWDKRKEQKMPVGFVFVHGD